MQSTSRRVMMPPASQGRDFDGAFPYPRVPYDPHGHKSEDWPSTPMVTIDGMMIGLSAGRLRELNDPALWPLIDAVDEATREAAIETLVTGTLKPIITDVLRRFRASEPGLRLEDLEE